MAAYFAVQGVQINIVNGDGYHIDFIGGLGIILDIMFLSLV